MNEQKKHSFILPESISMEDKKNVIFDTARKLFYEKGFKDTNVSEIANAAGIGVGTFYNYYSSKEELFLEVFVEENITVKQNMFKQITPNDALVAISTKMMTQYVNTVNSNRIIGEWYNKELFSKLERYFYQQNGMRSINDFMYNDITGLIKKWKSEGKIRTDIDDDMILAIFNSIIYIDMHKTDIGIKYFPKIITLLYEFITKGLAEPKK
jgi:hypothetical protein